MIPKSFRWAVLVGVAALALPLSGCLIEGPAKAPAYYPYVRIQPDYNLEAAPAGKIYELWAIKVDTATLQVTTTSLTRFLWDPELYLATGEDGQTVPLTTAPGLDVGVNLTEYYALIATIEPLNDPNPTQPDGPIFLVMNINTEYPTNPVVMRTPFGLLFAFGVPQPEVAYTLISQSNKKGVPGAYWRDGSEGNGIWFCAPTVLPKTTLDYPGGFDTYSQVFVPPAPDSPYIYTIWISTAHPDSSFSNFGRVFDTLEPDITFLDGVPQHLDTTKISATRVLRLGEEPIYIDGTVVGYRYYSADMRDTCDLRVDHPALTRCNRDTFDSLVFDLQERTPRQFTLSTGDTSMTPTMGLPDLPAYRANPQFIGMFEGWEYEAWLVFDKSTGIKPMSLGRFEGPYGFDSGNPYTLGGSRFDSNFAFPGEDFLQNLEQHDPQLIAPLNVITDSRVKKLWITMEPRQDPAHGYVDWAPDEPFTQMIFCSSWFPNAQQFVSDRTGTPPEATRPMSTLDRNPGPESLNEGHFWPTMVVFFNQASAK